MFALKQVKLKGMKRVDREEAIDEVRLCISNQTEQQEPSAGAAVY